MNLEMRLGVVGVFQNDEGLVLVGERRREMNSWQFPQGGVDAGETADQAVNREMREELGCDKFEIVKKSENMISYDFPTDLNSRIAKQFRGQSQYWYLLNFKDGDGPDLSKADHEFRAFRWLSVESAVKSVIPWKREAYIKGLKILGLLNEER